VIASFSRSAPAVWAAALAAGLMAGPAGATQRHLWWQSAELKAELKLTDEQSRQIDKIYEETLPKLRALKQQLDETERALSTMIDQMNADEWEVTLQIDTVEAARSALSKTRILMLYRMHRVLSRQQLDALHRFQDRQSGASRAPSR